MMKSTKLARDCAEIVRRGVKYYRFFFYAGALDRRVRRCSLEELRQRQFVKFRAIVRHAYRNLPFYQELYARHGVDPHSLNSWEDLHRLPIVTKEDLRANFPDRIVFQTRGRWRLRGPGAHRANYGRSSGTTGEAVQFLLDASWKKNGYTTMLWRRTGAFSPRTATLQTPQCSASSCSITDRPETLEDKMRGLLVKTRLNSYYHLPTSADIFHAGPDFFERLAQLMKRHRTEMICGASNYVGQFARHLCATGQTLPLVGAFCSSELLLDSVRAEIEKAFCCPVYNHYACSEIPGVADECECGLWHVRMDNVHLEITRNGQPCQRGQLGRVLLTDLDNYRMPLIRYDVGDLAREWPDPCHCGRRSQVLESVEGRIVDAWRDSRGELVSPAAVGRAAHQAGLSGRYRIVQVSPQEVEVEWVDAPDDMVACHRNGQDQLHKALTSKLEDLLGAAPKVYWRRVKRISPAKSNKYRLIYSEV